MVGFSLFTYVHDAQSQEPKLIESYFSNFRPLPCVMIPGAVQYNFDLLMMSTTVLETSRGI